MGGKVLNYEAKDILNRGRAEGRREGREAGRTEGEAAGIKKVQSAVKLLKSGKSVQEVSARTELLKKSLRNWSKVYPLNKLLILLSLTGKPL